MSEQSGATEVDESRCPYCDDRVAEGTRELRGKQIAHSLCVVLCKGNSRAMKHPKRKYWWAGMSKPDKAQWFRRQSNAAVVTKQAQWQHMPWPEYLKEQFLLKNDLATATANWNRDLMNSDVPKEMYNGQVCVGLFPGILGSNGTESRNKTTLAKKLQLELGEDADSVMANASKLHALEADAVSSSIGVCDDDRPDEQLPDEMISSGPMVSPLKGIAPDALGNKKVEALVMATELDDFHSRHK